MFLTRYAWTPWQEAGDEGAGGGADDDKGKGGQQDLDLGDKKPTAETVSKADYDSLKSNFETLSGEIKKLTKAGSTRSDKDRVAKGEAEKLLTEKAEQLETLTSRLETYEKRDQDRATELLHKLPEDIRGRLSPFKDKLETGDWLALLEAEAMAHIDDAGDKGQGDDTGDGDKTPTPPPTGSVMGAGGKRGREVSETAKTILDTMMRDPKYQDKLTMSKDADKPLKSKFSRPVKDFFKDMQIIKSAPFTKAEGDRRA